LKVDELTIGEIYKTGNSVHFVINKILKRHFRVTEVSYTQKNIDLYHPSLPSGIMFVTLWNHKRHNVSDEKPLIYLGHTREKWSLRFARQIIKKHHWFLFNGKKIILDNYSIRFLQKFERCEDEQMERS